MTDLLPWVFTNSWVSSHLVPRGGDDQHGPVLCGGKQDFRAREDLRQVRGQVPRTSAAENIWRPVWNDHKERPTGTSLRVIWRCFFYRCKLLHLVIHAAGILLFFNWSGISVYPLKYSKLTILRTCPKDVEERNARSTKQEQQQVVSPFR